MTVVVSDTSPLHYLILCDSVEVLARLFTQIVVPPAVFQELTNERTPQAVRQWAQSLPEWVKVQSPTTLHPGLNVDRGELEAISLALEIGASALLIDDRAGRTAAQRCGVAVTGTVGLLEMAAARGLLNLKQALAKLEQTNARLDAELVAGALQRDTARRHRESVPGPRGREDSEP